MRRGPARSTRIGARCGGTPPDVTAALSRETQAGRAAARLMFLEAEGDESVPIPPQRSRLAMLGDSPRPWPMKRAQSTRLRRVLHAHSVMDRPPSKDLKTLAHRADVHDNSSAGG